MVSCLPQMAKTILVADDSKTIRHVVHLAFQATDFRVVGVEGGRDAIERARAEQPALVLADVSMPGVDGYQLCQALKDDGSTAHIPVVLMAGAFEAFDERRAQAARADGHIKKPFETQKLIDQVQALTSRVAPAPAPAPVPVAAPVPVPAPAVAPAPVFAAPTPATMPMVAPPIPAQVFAAPARAAPPIDDLAAPFGAPRQEVAEVAPRSMSWEAQPIEEDLEPIDDAEPLDEVEVASPGYGPSLEPPTPPDELDAAQRRSVDVWALSADDEVEASAPVAARRAPTPAPIPTFDDEPVDEPMDAPDADLEPEPLAPAVSRLADTLAAPLASAAASAVPAGLPHDELVRLAREVLEQIAWEVVPELAETIIREELRRLLAERA